MTHRQVGLLLTNHLLDAGPLVAQPRTVKPRRSKSTANPSRRASCCSTKTRDGLPLASPIRPGQRKPESPIDGFRYSTQNSLPLFKLRFDSKVS
jgi:hypothetical protein